MAAYLLDDGSTMEPSRPVRATPRGLPPPPTPTAAAAASADDRIQTGNLAIDGAKNFGRFEAFFLPAPRWERVREAFWARTGFPVDPAAAVEQTEGASVGCVRPVPGGCR